MEQVYDLSGFITFPERTLCPYQQSLLNALVSSFLVCVSTASFGGLGNTKSFGSAVKAKTMGTPFFTLNCIALQGDGISLKPIWKLLKIENELHQEFQRASVERWQKTSEEDWDWDSYLLMQHHDGPTRLLDWSDGALMALHFALRNKEDDALDAYVYVLEPYRLMDKLEVLPDMKMLKEEWKTYVGKHTSYGLNEDTWEDCYLPSSEEANDEMNLPRPPLILEFPLITRRIAAQRSRFLVFGTEPHWLVEELRNGDSTIKAITIASSARPKIRQELRDCGITESVIYPDLDGLGREMRQLWEDRRSTADENA